MKKQWLVTALNYTHVWIDRVDAVLDAERLARDKKPARVWVLELTIKLDTPPPPLIYDRAE